MGDYDEKIINKEPAQAVRERHHNSIAWIMYARRIQKNPYIRRYIANKYDNTCQFCGKPLPDDFVIHHANYDRECYYPDRTIDIPHPTPKRPNRIRQNLPDCEYCDKIAECTQDLYPVCGICNAKIAGIATKQREASQVRNQNTSEYIDKNTAARKEEEDRNFFLWLSGYKEKEESKCEEKV